MAEDSDPDSKTEDATPRKLEEARRKGDVAKSPDVAQTLSLMGAAAVVIFGGGYFSTRMAEAFVPFIASPHVMLGVIDSGSGAQIGMTALWAVEGPPFRATERTVQIEMRLLCEGLEGKRLS